MPGLAFFFSGRFPTLITAANPVLLGRYDSLLSPLSVQGGGLPSDGSLIAVVSDLELPSQDAVQVIGSSAYPIWDVDAFPKLPMLLFSGGRHMTVDPGSTGIVGVGVVVDPASDPGRVLITRDTSLSTTGPAFELVIEEDIE